MVNQGKAASLRSYKIEVFLNVGNDQHIFIHVPKTGGTTLRSIVERHYNGKELYRIYDRKSVFNNMDDFMRLSDEEKKYIKAYTGHFSFGLHEYLPGNARYFAMLRHPVNRVISYYHHEMTFHDNFKDRKVSLIKFINMRNLQVDNLQTRYLSGIQAPFGGCSEEMLWTAISNIDQHFFSIGINERYDESLSVLATLMDWAESGYVKENVSKGRPSEEFYSQMEINQIINHNRLDMFLYSYAQRKLDRQIRKLGNEVKLRLGKLKEDKIRCESIMVPKTVW